MNNPLVTCICPTTAARMEWIPRALACFLSQTYENREFLLVTEPGFNLETLWVDERRDDRVRSLPFNAGLLGAKRNFGSREARGEIICNFDDDDWSAPERIAFQVDRLERSGKPVTGLGSMKFTDGKNWWRYKYADVGDDWPLGTSLCYRKSWWEKHPFREDMHVGTDTFLINEARSLKEVDVVPCGNMMYVGVHAGNLNKRNYGPPSFELLPASEAINA